MVDDFVVIFFGVFMILVCEGLEVMLVVVVLLVFLCKVEWFQVVWYVYVGWVLVLVVGGIIWVLVSYVILISGVGCELIEGLLFLFVVVVLFSVGFWMYQKSIGG